MTSLDLGTWDQVFDSEGSDKQFLLDQIEDATNKEPDNVELLWRGAMVALNLANECKVKKMKSKQQILTEKAVNLAKRALEVDYQCFEGHVFYCAAVGGMTDFVGVKERIECGHEMKKHSKIAIGLNSASKYLSLIYHMYGRFCYSIASISWIEIKVATAIFGAPPTASYEEALEALEKAKTLYPQWVCNNLWISKVLIAQRRYVDALQVINSALQLKVKDAEDSLSHEELLELKDKYSKYS